MPNTIGGYMPGPRDFIGNRGFPSNSQTIVEALKQGYVVVSSGIRGRTLRNTSGKNIGCAPAFIVDMKAAIRFVVYNDQKIPGNTNRIITNGTSAGGATSALIGCSANHPYFDPFLKELGAAEVSDKVYAVSSYCPIHNLEHADSAYEWQFSNHHFWKSSKLEFENGKPLFTPIEGYLTKDEIQLSKKLKLQFPEYIESLKMTDNNGNLLFLDKNGDGSFKSHIINYLKQSAQLQIEKGEDLSGLEFLEIESGLVKEFDWDAYLTYISRMKRVPAFDSMNLDSPENELFSDDRLHAKHFTNGIFEQELSTDIFADRQLVKMINPIEHILSAETELTTHWRIRHGAADRDTSFAIPVILATLLQNKGQEVDFALPWGVPHKGDYDLLDLFSWIDSICK